MRNRTGLVTLIVLAVATLLMVFFVLPNMKEEKPAETPVTAGADTSTQAADDIAPADGKQARAPQAVEATEAGDGALPPDSAAQDAPLSPDTADASAQNDAQTVTTPETETTPAADPTADWTEPAFDLLRVEPDGSTVIAGRAEPDTTIDVHNGETVIATADVGPSGDFAVVLDEPLAAGDYQLTLTARDDKGATKASEEVATISVPQNARGDLLAMVSRPGEASRLITVPETEATPETAQPATEVAEAAGSTPTPAGGDASASQTTTDAAPATAQADPGAAENGAAAGEAPVRVAAVELEGDRIFVAGNARPGALIRIYADDRLIGEQKADAEGRYVIEGTIDLSVGRHTIRADVMNAGGDKVAFRASVPFDRPEGEQVAVVARTDASAQAAPTLGPVGDGTFDKLRDEAGMALALLKGLYADGRTPTAEELAAARSATEIALKSLAEFKPGVNEGAAASEMAGRAATAAAAALTRLQALPQDAESIRTALDAIETSVQTVLTPALERDDTEGQAVAAGETGEVPAPPAGTATSGAPAVASPGDAVASADANAAQPEAADEPETVEQAPLQPSNSSVIIRRGDTLWQISRRIYGKGIRYTTIYLANQSQISNPDLIIPGQIFGVPEETTESDADAEALHRKHLHGD